MIYKNISTVRNAIGKILRNNLFGHVDFIAGISRGGLIPAVLIATELNKPLITLYIDKSDKVYIDRREWILDKKVLIVDDICRTGKTLSLMSTLVRMNGALFVETLTVFCLTDSVFKPDFFIPTNEDIKFLWDHDK